MPFPIEFGTVVFACMALAPVDLYMYVIDAQSILTRARLHCDHGNKMIYI